MYQGKVKISAAPYLNVRNAPEGTKVGTLKPGAAVIVSFIRDGWAKVTWPVVSNNAQRQYALGAFLDLKETTDPGPGQPPQGPFPRPDGWLVCAGDGQTPVVLRHDPFDYPRTLDMTLLMTNETWPALEYRPAENKVVPGKVITPIWQRPAWVTRCVEMMGMRTWSRFITPGYGFCDTNEAGIDPLGGQIKLGAVDCGGNLRNVLQTVGPYAIVQSQNFYNAPNANLTYLNAPHLHEIQTLVGDTRDNPWFVRLDPKEGTVTWPWVTRVPVAHAINNIEYYPALPYQTMLDGVPVTIIQYCFRGSDTYGYVSGSTLPDGWYMLDQMWYPAQPQDPPFQANDRNRVLHVPLYNPDGNRTGWPVTCRAPYGGWTRVS